MVHQIKEWDLINSLNAKWKLRLIRSAIVELENNAGKVLLRNYSFFFQQI